MQDIRRPVVLLAIVVVLTIILIALSQLQDFGHEHNWSGSRDTHPRPPLSDTTRAYLERSKGFELLVSYTDRGFEPSLAGIKKGQTVRFTNNSSGPLWIVPLPGSSHDGCGRGGFDSCSALSYGEFWEFTFNATGTWSYYNDVGNASMGVLTVR